MERADKHRLLSGYIDLASFEVHGTIMRGSIKHSWSWSKAMLCSRHSDILFVLAFDNVLERVIGAHSFHVGSGQMSCATGHGNVCGHLGVPSHKLGNRGVIKQICARLCAAKLTLHHWPGQS